MGDTAAFKQSGINAEEEVSRVLEQLKGLEESATSFISEASSKEQDLCQRALNVHSSINQIFSLINSLANDGVLYSSVVDKLRDKLHAARLSMDNGMVAQFLPVKAQGGFLKMFLGPISVCAPGKHVQLKVKEEYNS